MMEKRRVVITGMGAVTPLGHTVSETWEAARAGVCGIAPITLYDTSSQKVSLAAEVKNFDPTKVLDKKEVRRMDRFSQFAMYAAAEAMADSGLDLEQEDTARIGVCVSSGVGGMQTFQNSCEVGESRGFDKVSPFFIPMIIANLAAGRIAIRYGLHGMCTCPVTACAGGSNAVGDAFHYIRDGYADAMVSGGAEATITSLAIGGFTSMSALTTASDPKRASIPFDKERSGFVMGEGAGILVLEELEHAKARGAKIYGEIVGYGTNCDAHHITAPRSHRHLAGGLHPAGPERRGHRPGAGGLCERPRHLHPPERQRRDRRPEEGVRGPRRKADGQLHQVHDRTHAGGRRRGGGHLQPAGSEGRLCPRHHQLPGARPRL